MNVIAWLSLLVLVAVGCTQAGEPSGQSTTVLVFKHGRLSGDGRILSDLLREFEQSHPGVVVREEVLPASSDQQHQYYAMNLDGGTVPYDLLGVDTIWVEEFAKAG